MKFSIITPSFNQLAYLQRCIASVADQPGVEIEHLVMDGGSTDGTVAWLQEAAVARSTERYQLRVVSAPDAGMYDALNKGFQLATGELRAWLNCDEQYLPGALQKTARYFADHPERDWVCGDALLVTPGGRLIAYRKNPPLRRAYMLADHLYAQSAALFFRAGIFAAGLRFCTGWKAVGDCDFVSRVLAAGFRGGQLRDYLAACTMTGENLSRRPAGVDELLAFRRAAPPLYRLGRPVLNLLRYAEKALRGGYRQSVPFDYALYPENAASRATFVVRRADFRFRWGADE